MIKFGTINFNDAIVDALRDDKLVIFAGAGVSKAPPSNLPDFKTLCEAIAEGMGMDYKNQDNKGLDFFLGRLKNDSVKVHERAQRILKEKMNESTPGPLHKDLLRLFQVPDRVKLVTTNFDPHFQNAASNVFGSNAAKITVHCAPALPRGSDFTGIVHLHGALSCGQEKPHLVLTDMDFGVAYLKDRWAKRFLFEMFSHFTVLFVGYSHHDGMMHYLSRAFYGDRKNTCFALTAEEEKGHWEQYGIQPLCFKTGSDKTNYTELYDSVKKLPILLQDVPRTGRSGLRRSINLLKLKQITTKSCMRSTGMT